MANIEEALFYDAVRAVIDGDIARLDDLLGRHPALATARAPAGHRATLLHYVAANGVEDELQRSPPNAVEVARRLLAAGVEVDALAETYGGGLEQTPLALLVSSAHPARAGVQAGLIEALLDAAAAIDGLDGDGCPIATAVAFGYGEAAQVLAQRGARIPCLQVAAALGDKSRVEAYFDQDGRLQPGAGYYSGPWFLSGETGQAALDHAFWYACLHGQLEIAAFLLAKGADIGTKGHEGLTAVHSAACRGDGSTLGFLLDRQAPLEVLSDYGATPLSTVAYCAANLPQPGVDYVAMAEALIAAGASVAAVSPYPSGHAGVDAVLSRHR